MGIICVGGGGGGGSGGGAGSPDFVRWLDRSDRITSASNFSCHWDACLRPPSPHYPDSRVGFSENLRWVLTSSSPVSQTSMDRKSGMHGKTHRTEKKTLACGTRAGLRAACLAVTTTLQHRKPTQSPQLFTQVRTGSGGRQNRKARFEPWQGEGASEWGEAPPPETQPT